MSGSSPYPAVSKNGDDLPEWLAELRRRGHEAWSAMGMPRSDDESWKYVDLDFALDDFRPAGAPPGRMEADPYLDALENVSGRLILVDGTVVLAESGTADVAGVLDMPGGKVAHRYASAGSLDIDIFKAANRAFAPPGGVVVFPEGRPIRSPVLVDVQAVTGGAASFPHVTVIGEPGSEGSVVLVYRSQPGAEVLVCPNVEVWADRSARLGVSVVQQLGDTGRMVAHHQLVAGRDSTLRVEEIGLGGRYARQRLGISLVGMGSSARMNGIYFGDGRQVLDYRIHVTHTGPRTTSDIFLKGAVADRAQAVWTGLMRIENSAIGTSAFETNRNLVLSDGAKVHSVPNLEILTDDLQCGHGSSSGPLDQDQLYYLMSRGLPRDRAERLLVRGFFDEILSKLAIPHLAAPARREVAARFAGAQQARRDGA